MSLLSFLSAPRFFTLNDYGDRCSPEASVTFSGEDRLQNHTYLGMQVSNSPSRQVAFVFAGYVEDLFLLSATTVGTLRAASTMRSVHRPYLPT